MTEQPTHLSKDPLLPSRQKNGLMEVPIKPFFHLAVMTAPLPTIADASLDSALVARLPFDVRLPYALEWQSVSPILA
ncbi:MAG: hypothetical protein MJY59_03590 [Bacteroidaceae bacterium]|nr:hypothetical protein [Bacteroidaceae bacterium]